MIGIEPRGGRIGRTVLAALLLAGLAAGCRDSGLPDRNLPKADAERRVYDYPAYQAAAETPVWEVGGRRWQASGAVQSIDAGVLRPVAGAGGTTLYALQWDEEPYDRLYTPATNDLWQPVETID